jgi:hypothetical protein
MWRDGHSHKGRQVSGIEVEHMAPALQKHFVKSTMVATNKAIRLQM